MKTEDIIKRHEGYSNKVYLDTEGVPTVGWGHALHVGSKVSRDVCEALFRRDMNCVCRDYDSLGFRLDEVRRSVVMNMLFNLGLSKFKKFRKTIKHIRNGDYYKASDEMLDSKWADQVGTRAIELSVMMATGKWPEGE